MLISAKFQDYVPGFNGHDRTGVVGSGSHRNLEINRNWENIALYAVIPIADYLQRPENIQGKGNFLLC